MPNKRFENIIGTNYYLYIQKVADQLTAHEKLVDFIAKSKDGKGISSAPTGKYLGVLYKEVASKEKNPTESSMEEIPTRTKFFHVTDTKLEKDELTGCVLLKGAFSGLENPDRIRPDRRECGSALLIPELDKVREFTDDTIIYDRDKFTTYSVEIYDDKEKDVSKKIKYNFLNIFGQLIRRENFEPVGENGRPIIESVSKPFYEKDDTAHNGFVNDITLLKSKGINIFPTAYVYRGKNSCECFPTPAAFLLANRDKNNALAENDEVIIQAHRNRMAELDDIIGKIGMEYDYGRISERTYGILLRQFNYEYLFSSEFEKLYGEPDKYL